MRLSLLTPPAESPRTIPQIPLPQNWPGERHLAVDTGALPRSLPPMPPLGLVAMDPGASSAPFEALARAGSAGAQLGTNVLNMVMEAEARKQEANTLARVTNRYADTVIDFDKKFEQAKVQSDHETIRPAFDQIWKETVQPAMDAETDPKARQALGLKFAGYRVTKSAEVSDVANAKFKAHQLVSLTKEVDLDAKLATEAPDDATRDFHLKNMAGTFRAYTRAGAIDVTTIETMQTKRLDQVRTDRAYGEAYRNPVSTFQRLTQGDTFGLDTKELRQFSEYTDGRIRTMRSDVNALDEKQRREAKAQQDDLAITFRQRITENYQPGGPGRDLLADVNGAARNLGETNHAQLLEMERVYRERYTNPKKEVVTSDLETVGKYQHAIQTRQFQQVSQADLLRSFRDKQLNEGDYTRLSNLLDTKIRQDADDRQKPKTEADQLRDRQTKDAEKLIDEYLSRGSRFQGDPESTRTGILTRDAITELHVRLDQDPQAAPLDVADDLIVKRIAEAERKVKALPYRSKEEVRAAYEAQRIDKRTATRYYRILEAMEKSGVSASRETGTPPPAPGLGQRFTDFWNTPLTGGGPPADPNAVRPPVK